MKKYVYIYIESFPIVHIFIQIVLISKRFESYRNPSDLNRMKFAYDCPLQFTTCIDYCNFIYTTFILLYHKAVMLRPPGIRK